MKRRSSAFLSIFAVSVGACQLLQPKTVVAPAPAPGASSASVEPARLPPEETPPAEPEKPQTPPDARPVEPGITNTGGPTRGTLPKAVIDEKLKGIAPELHACYERALKVRPELRGSVNVDFVIAPDGKVAFAAAREEDGALDDQETVTCILERIRQLEFPVPRGGRVFVNYPIDLAPAK